MPLSGPLPAAGAQRLGRGLSCPRRLEPPSPWTLLSQGFGVVFCCFLGFFLFFSPPFLKFPFFQSIRQVFEDALEAKTDARNIDFGPFLCSDYLFSCCRWVPPEPEGKGMAERLRGETSDVFTRRARLTHLLSGAGAGGHWRSWLV